MFTWACKDCVEYYVIVFAKILHIAIRYVITLLSCASTDAGRHGNAADADCTAAKRNC